MQRKKGFAKEQLRVQLRSRSLIISGERKLQQNTWSRFRVEFPVSVNCDLNKISAKFEGNILFVRQGKVITLAAKPEEERRPVVAAPVPTTPKPVYESNMAEKTTAEKKPISPTQPDMENKGKDQEVSKMGGAEKSEKGKGKAIESKKAEGVRGNASEKKPSDSDNKNKKVVYGELDKTTKTALENYKHAVGVFATKLKTSRNAVNTIVILLVALVVGVYVSGSIKSWTKS
ncbi:HSP20-like chaperone [Cynara cardunculus var. scolymus]|uniref:HSP20-like chaperone n=1 Tax=Cynara cardunculus var. scolymus TaxID=59895 RepID=A0A103YHW5_CYNCS|nr:HSP20-like chaperone [Cynara cardunculus var. scolymus]